MSFDETLISVHGAVLWWWEMKVTPLVQIFLDGRAFKAESGCQEEKWWKSDENIFFAADAGNVGQEDPTVWIGYMCMIAISFFHSRITFCRNFFLQNSFLPGSFWCNLSLRKWPIVIWAARRLQIKVFIAFTSNTLKHFNKHVMKIPVLFHYIVLTYFFLL